MKFQFYRLFIFLLLSSGLVIWSFGQIADSLQEAEHSYQIDVNALLAPENGHFANISHAKRSSLALPANLADLLDKGHTIALRHSSGAMYYYRMGNNDTDILMLGPIAEKPQSNSLIILILLGLYSSLTLVALWLIWPVFRDLNRLQTSAIQFGQHPSKQAIRIHKHSAIYPLAKAFYKVSHQIVDFVQMHKELSRTISHEVRTPLARMRFALELIREQIPANYADRLGEDIMEIEQLAANYLSFARLEHKEDQLQQAPQDVAAYMENIANKYALYQSQLTIQFNNQTQQAHFDPTTMTVAVQNLIQNAMRFARSSIIVSFVQHDGINSLCVEDDGPGFEGEGKKLFAAFERDTNQSDSSGYGLGLYIVRKVAIWHQGKLELSPSHLGGAALSIQWPQRAIP